MKANEIIESYCFLTIGKTQESTESSQEFKRYIGVGSSYVLAVNPTKEEYEKITGREQSNAPEYVVDGENGKEARIHFIVKTDSEACNGIDLISRVMFTLRSTPAYNRDQTKVQVKDKYGNTVWARTEDAKAGKKLMSADGKDLKIDNDYKMCCAGEADLIAFMKTYLRVPESFEYVNGSWGKKKDADEGLFELENIKEYFKGNFSELKEALALQPNNKVKLLYGVRTSETENGPRQYQAVASKGEFILPNNAGSKRLLKLEKDLAAAKAAGSYSTTEFKVQDLQEWTVEATDLSQPKETASDDPFAGGSSSEMPWD